MTPPKAHQYHLAYVTNRLNKSNTSNVYVRIDANNNVDVMDLPTNLPTCHMTYDTKETFDDIHFEDDDWVVGVEYKLERGRKVYRDVQIGITGTRTRSSTTHRLEPSLQAIRREVAEESGLCLPRNIFDAYNTYNLGDNKTRDMYIVRINHDTYLSKPTDYSLDKDDKRYKVGAVITGPVDRLVELVFLGNKTKLKDDNIVAVVLIPAKQVLRYCM